MGLNIDEHSAEEIERAILEIGFVEAARVVLDNGSIEEVHILARSGRIPKLLVRDIESVLMARFFISLDHKKISVAQLGDEKNSGLFSSGLGADEVETSAHPNLFNRVTVSEIKSQMRNNRLVCTVTLCLNDEDFVGIAKGINTYSSKLKLLAEATLSSISEISPNFSHCDVEDVQMLSMGMRKVCVVCISQLQRHGEDSISGSAILRHDEKDCVVKAVLDAVNRQFTSNDLLLN